MNLQLEVGNFHDPTEWIVEHYPWTASSEWSDHLNRLRLEDIIADSGSISGRSASSMDMDVMLHSVTTQSSGNGTQCNDIDGEVDKINDPFVS